MEQATGGGSRFEFMPRQSFCSGFQDHNTTLWYRHEIGMIITTMTMRCSSYFFAMQKMLCGGAIAMEGKRYSSKPNWVVRKLNTRHHALIQI